MDFVKSHLESADLEKKWAKGVPLVRVSFFLSDFLQNPYFSKVSDFIADPNQDFSYSHFEL